MKSYDDAAEFHRFFEEEHRPLARFAYLLVGDADAADDLTADAFVATWRRWGRAADQPIASVRRRLVDLATSRARSSARGHAATEPVEAVGAAGGGREDEALIRDGEPDAEALPHLRAALRSLPPSGRACMALRYAFDLTERETAAMLGVSARDVRRRTARGVAEVRKVLSRRRPPRARGRGAAGAGADGDPIDDWLRFALHREAYAYEPDRVRMRARVAATLRARVARRVVFRRTGAVLGIAATAAVAVTATSYLTAPDARVPRNGSAPGNPPPPGHRTAAGTPPAADASIPPGPPVIGSSARIDARSNDHWSQNDLDVTTDRPLTSLRVTVRVVRTAGARPAGSWLSLPADDFVVTARQDARHIVYQWTLKAGRTVPAGAYVFAARYTHAPARHDSRRDVYTVTASAGTGKPVDARGHF